MSKSKQLTLHTYFKGSPGKKKKNEHDDSFQRQWLIDAIVRIRAHKQKPDKDRICTYVQNGHPIAPNTIYEELDKAVADGDLITVQTRGNTDKLTYVIADLSKSLPINRHKIKTKQPDTKQEKIRPSTNGSGVKLTSTKSDALQTSVQHKPVLQTETSRGIPATKMKTESSRMAPNNDKVIINNNTDVKQFMLKAVRGLRSSTGSSLNDIAEYIITSCQAELGDSVDLIKLLKAAARSAVKQNLLMKNKDNTYKLSRGMLRAPSSDPSKKTPKPIIICSFCLEGADKNKKGQYEEMVSCVNCGQSGHPTCLQWSKEVATVVRELGNWLCLDCKICSECETTKRTDYNLLMCDRCDRAFHLHCVKPSLSKPPPGKWLCHKCHGVSSATSSNCIKKKSRSVCKTHGCDGNGNVNPKLHNHRAQTACPLLSPEARKNLREHKQVQTDSSENENGEVSRTGSTTSTNENNTVPGLVDGLSAFFKPSDKRKSRVSMNSMLTSKLHSAAAANNHNPLNKKSSTQTAASRLLKKSRNNTLGRSVRREAHPFYSVPIDGLPSQLKGLVDGMTKFFTPAGERTKERPSYAPPSRKKMGTKSGAEESDSAAFFSDEGKTDTEVKDAIDKDNLPLGVSMKDYRVFRRSQKQTDKKPALSLRQSLAENKRFPPVIEFGPYEITTWYSSPYPQEYAQLPKLYICEFCLKYMKSKSILERHLTKCGLTHPPANEIYRKNGLSVFEVDGNTNKIYCQNLCLLAKLFLDHKTLYYDVEPFLFYVLTKNDHNGCHFIGYFSKEKHCQQKYNVSCITTLPQHQRRGYGKFLIDFSYLLSRVEGASGSPEKPLSELGKVSYEAYWRSALLAYLNKHRNDSNLSVKQISTDTGICPHDIAATLERLDMIETTSAGDIVITINWSLVTSVHPPQLTIDEDYLRWTPLVLNRSLSSPGQDTPRKSRLTRLSVSSVADECEPVKSPPARRMSRQNSRVLPTHAEEPTVSPTRSSRHNSPNKSIKLESPTRVISSPTHTLSSPRMMSSPIRKSDHSRIEEGKKGVMHQERKMELKRGNAEVQGRSDLKKGKRKRTNGLLKRIGADLIEESSDEDAAAPVHRPPPKRRRCKEDKLNGVKNGSPSTPDKRRGVSRETRSSRNVGNTRSSSTFSQRQNNVNSGNGEKKRAAASNHVDPAVDSMSLNYDASASDTDSCNTDIENSDCPAPWSPSYDNRHDTVTNTQTKQSELLEREVRIEEIKRSLEADDPYCEQFINPVRPTQSDPSKRPDTSTPYGFETPLTHTSNDTSLALNNRSPGTYDLQAARSPVSFEQPNISTPPSEHSPSTKYSLPPTAPLTINPYTQFDYPKALHPNFFAADPQGLQAQLLLRASRANYFDNQYYQRGAFSANPLGGQYGSLQVQPHDILSQGGYQYA